MDISIFVERWGAAGVLMAFALFYLWSNHQAKKRSDDLMKQALDLNENFQQIQKSQNELLARTRDRIADALEAMNRRHDILEINLATHATDVSFKIDELKKTIVDKFSDEGNST